MAMGRERFDSSEARAVQTTGQDNMRVQATVIKLVDRREDHSNLKADSGLCGRHLHRSAVAHEGSKTFVERDGVLTFAFEKFLH